MEQPVGRISDQIFQVKGLSKELWPPKKIAACILWRHYISVISVENYINICGW